jgi:hypothetical protein
MIDINKLEVDDIEVLAAALKVTASRLPKDGRFLIFKNSLNCGCDALFDMTYNFEQLKLELNRVETPEQYDQRMYAEVER